MRTTSIEMTRSRLAATLALTLMAGAASAQVSLSGRVDQSIIKSSPGNWEMKNGSASRLILRGEENIGSDTKAYFYLQQRFEADTGAQRSGPFWYYSYVGLKGNYGNLSLGHQKSPLDDATGSDYEVWDGDTVASSVSRIAGGQKIWDNSINYTTPSFAGFRVNTGISADEEVAKVVRGQGASLIYDNGGFSTSVSTQRSPTNVQTKGIGGRYVDSALGYRVLGTWARSKRVAGSKEQTDWQISAGYFATQAGEARVLYNQSELSGVKTQQYGLGYFHTLSKRTALYAATSHTRVDNKPTVNAYQAGIRHLF